MIILQWVRLLLFVCIFQTVSSNEGVYDYSENSWPPICQTGKRNSPIDFPPFQNYTNYVNTTDYIQLVSSSYNVIADQAKFIYESGKYYIHNIAGGTVGNLTVFKNNITYNYILYNIHFHIQSEHTFNGIQGDFEIHFVHKKDTEYLKSNNITDTEPENSLLVVGVIFNANSETNNTDIQKMNLENGNFIDNLDLSKYVTTDKNFYHYLGGLTTPNCDETVNWVVVEDAEEMSTAQYDVIKEITRDAYPNGNDRRTRPLNNRTIYYVKNSSNNLLFFAVIIFFFYFIFVYFLIKKYFI
jgi:carbonic anhydrase